MELSSATFPKTIQYITTSIRLGIESLDDFNILQRQELMYELFSELDYTDKLDIINDSFIDDEFMMNKLVGLSYLSSAEIEDLNSYLTNLYWSNSQKILERLFDLADVENFSKCMSLFPANEEKIIDDKERRFDINEILKDRGYYLNPYLGDK